MTPAFPPPPLPLGMDDKRFSRRDILAVNALLLEMWGERVDAWKLTCAETRGLESPSAGLRNVAFGMERRGNSA